MRKKTHTYVLSSGVSLMLSVMVGCAAEPARQSIEEIPAKLWKDATAETIGVTEYWTNRVDIADLNGDRLPDLLFAMGGTNNEPLDPTMSRVYFNQGPGKATSSADGGGHGGIGGNYSDPPSGGTYGSIFAPTNMGSGGAGGGTGGGAP